MSFIKRLLLHLEFVLYEITYYFLGGRAIIDDVLSKKKNVCPITDCHGQVAVVTGGARGIGSALVKKLMMCNMTVIIGCRNVQAGEEKVKQFRTEGITSGHVYVYQLDLMSFNSIKMFSKTIQANHDVINILVNNAGIMFSPYQETIDGHESQWSVNFLGPALLTHLLLPLLEEGSVRNGCISSRVVNVTSCAHVVAKPIDLRNVNMKTHYISSLAYAQSKLAQILLTIELDRKLKNKGSKVSVYAVHPGIVDSDLFDGTILKKLMPWVLKNMCKSIEEGATSVLFPCISPTLNGIGGIYTTNCQLTTPGSIAMCEKQQKQLYEYTLKILGTSEFGNLAC